MVHAKVGLLLMAIQHRTRHSPWYLAHLVQHFPDSPLEAMTDRNALVNRLKSRSEIACGNNLEANTNDAAIAFTWPFSCSVGCVLFPAAPAG